jgi:putative heme-binding domain-containing protein
MSVVFTFVVTAPLAAQRDAKIPDPDPEVERRTFRVAPGFEVNLFAADPLLAKPIQMNWDPAGRLWLACSEAYPQIKPGQKANDKILILEDTKGVGKADKVTVFADGLLIPTGLEPGDGGVYVANSTDLIHLSAPDKRGKATRRRVVLSGFGTEDTHHMLHTLRWGHDGLLYMNQSIYIHSHIETPHGVRRLGGGGVWQFRPATRRLEVFVRGFWNPWGHHFDRWGQSFLTDGAGGEGVNYGLPGARYAAAPDAVRLLPGMNPGHPKYCGCEILSGRHLSEDWRGTLVTNDFRANRVCRFRLTPAGAAYTAQPLADVIRSTHPAFRPVDVKMGPDGAIYIADWYNPIIQHGEVDFRDPRRDVTHGRIWRVTSKDRPILKRPKLVGAKTADLLDALKAPEGWTRHHARRVLQERGAKEVLPDLKAWAARLDTTKPDDVPHLLEALWTYQALDVVEPKLLATLLRAGDHRVRAAAARVVSMWHDRLANPLALVADLATDEHPQVRLEAVRALGRLRSVRAAELALQTLERPVDRYLDYGLWLTMRELEPRWVPALRRGKFHYGHARRLAFALEAVGSERVVQPLAALVRAGKLSADGEDGVLRVLAGVGGPEELGLLLERAAAAKTPQARRARLLESLEEAARQRGLRPASDLARILPLVQAGDPVAARLAGFWRLEGARPNLLSLARTSDKATNLRLAAIEGLAALGGKDSRDALEGLAKTGTATEVRKAALAALTGLDLPAAAGRAVELLAEVKEAERTADVFEAFLQRKNGAAALAKAVKGKELPADVAKVGVRTVRTSGRSDGGLLDALVKAGRLTFGVRRLSPAELKAMAVDVAKHGDPGRGERVFRRADQLCLRCHAIGGAGGQVGPDLSSIGASAPVDYLIESLLEPSKAIKENYHAMLVSTTRGKQYTGIKVRQTERALILRTDQDKEVVIPLNDIEEQTPSKTSLMPDGLTDTLTRGELLDLVRFLSELGRVGPYSVGKARLARRWEALEPTSLAVRLLSNDGEGAVLRSDATLTWTPAYATVAGRLSPGDVPALKVKDSGISLLRCQIEATAAARVRLRLAGATDVRPWLDGKALKGTEFAMPAGLRTLALAIDRASWKDGLRLEIVDDPGAAAVRFVTGK